MDTASFNKTEYTGVEIKTAYNGIRYVMVEDLPEPSRAKFNDWLVGQTRPIIEEEGNRSMQCAYEEDYFRWVHNLPIID